MVDYPGFGEREIPDFLPDDTYLKHLASPVFPIARIEQFQELISKNTEKGNFKMVDNLCALIFSTATLACKDEEDVLDSLTGRGQYAGRSDSRLRLNHYDNCRNNYRIGSKYRASLVKIARKVREEKYGPLNDQEQ